MRETPGQRLLAALGWREDRPARLVALFAHPDDETLALGGHLIDFTAPLIVHATDGAPRDLNDARAHGFATACDYAGARRSELLAALTRAGLGAEALLNFAVADQQAMRNLAPLTRRFADIVAERQPDFVFTHAYEGGHPDHDAVAFVARAAIALAGASSILVEAPLYHGERGAFVRQTFALEPVSPSVRADLPAGRQAMKQEMLDCFVSQRATLASFHVVFESFRRGPRQDFTRAPNGGEFLYEGFDWGLRGADFLAFARTALSTLGLGAWL